MAEASATLHEPFEAPLRQREATVFGLWCFLASEVLLFGGLFVVYAFYRWTHSAELTEAARHTNVVFGTANTAILLTSSFAIAVAGRALEAGNGRLAEVGIWTALLLGLSFLVVKGFEYREDLHEHLWPGVHFALSGSERIFFALYWLMTAVHGLHVTIGLTLIARIGIFARRGVLAANNDSMEVTSLYWHLVDAIWVMLYPLLYLVGR